MNVCILARKRLVHNTRVVRQAGVLAGAGHDVTVVSLERPNAELMSATPTVRYLEVSAATPIDRLRGWLLGVRAKLAGRPVEKPHLNRDDGKLINPHAASDDPSFQERGTRGPFSGGVPDVQERGSMRPLGERPGVRARIAALARTIGRTIWRVVWSRLVPFVAAQRTVKFAHNTARELKGQRFDYCQAHDSFALLAAKKLTAGTGARLIYDAVEAPQERSGLSLAGTPQFLRWLETRRDCEIIHRAAKVLTVGKALADWTASQYGIESPVVVRNCSTYVDEPQCDQMRRDLGLDEEAQIVLLLGSIYQHQGVEQVIDCVADLLDTIHVAIMGPVTQARYDLEIEQRIASAGVQHRVHLLAPRPQQEVIAYASGADLGLIALQRVRLNHRVALPNKLFEYIMARLPVVTGRLPDVCSVVEKHGIGLVFDETEPTDIARAINEVLKPASYPGYRAAVCQAAGELCWETESHRYLDLFE